MRIAIRVNGQEKLWEQGKARDYYKFLVGKGGSVTEEEARERHWLYCLFEHRPQSLITQYAEERLEEEAEKHINDSYFTDEDDYEDKGEYDEHGVPMWTV